MGLIVTLLLQKRTLRFPNHITIPQMKFSG